MDILQGVPDSEPEVEVVRDTIRLNLGHGLGLSFSIDGMRRTHGDALTWRAIGAAVRQYLRSATGPAGSNHRENLLKRVQRWVADPTPGVRGAPGDPALNLLRATVVARRLMSATEARSASREEIAAAIGEERFQRLIESVEALAGVSVE